MTHRIPAGRQSSSSFYRLLLVLSLVISQYYLVLHQLDVEHYANAKECSICLASHALGHGLVSNAPTLVALAEVEPPAIQPAVFLPSRNRVRQVARSPPVSALHA